MVAEWCRQMWVVCICDWYVEREARALTLDAPTAQAATFLTRKESHVQLTSSAGTLIGAPHDHVCPALTCHIETWSCARHAVESQAHCPLYCRGFVTDKATAARPPGSVHDGGAQDDEQSGPRRSPSLPLPSRSPKIATAGGCGSGTRRECSQRCATGCCNNPSNPESDKP